MTAEQWLTEAHDVLIAMPDSVSILALDAVEKALAAIANATLYATARDAVEIVSFISPVHAPALAHLM